MIPNPAEGVIPAGEGSNAETPSTYARKPLSCTSCRKRKIKCDRVYPCVHCQKYRISCVFPTRASLSRPKPAVKRSSELLRRIGRLENLVNKIDVEKIKDGSYHQASHVIDPMPFLAPAATFADDVARVPIPQYGLKDKYAAFVSNQSNRASPLGGEFWTSMTDEVDGIRQLLENSGDDEEEEEEEEDYSHSGHGHSSTESQRPQTSFLFRDAAHEEDLTRYYPSNEDRDILFRLYFANVNPLCRILHELTGKMFLVAAEELIDEKTGRIKFASMEAVLFAMYFITIMSLAPEQCTTHFNEQKEILLARYKSATELALTQADFMNTTELVTLQALVLYMMAIRTSDKSRTSWAFLGLVLRLAHGIGLHKDGDGKSFSPHEAEMRRRLWWQVLVLDVRAADDRGSEPMILDGSFNTAMPLNVNDSDFSVISTEPLQARTGITDMTFCLISIDTANVARKLIAPSLSEDRPALILTEKEELVKQCSYRIENQYLAGRNFNNPTAWAYFMLGRFLVLKLWTQIQYPVQKRQRELARFPRGQALRTVIAVLELAELFESHIDGAPSHLVWFFKSWIPWHPLAVAFVELCAEPIGPLADKAWAIINQGYAKWSSRVSGSKDGLKWRPIRRLHKKAQDMREAAIATTESRDPHHQPTHERDVEFAPGSVVPQMSILNLEHEATAEQSPVSEALPYNLPTPGNNFEFQPTYMPWDDGFAGEAAMNLDFVNQEVELNWDDWNDFVFDINNSEHLG